MRLFLPIALLLALAACGSSAPTPGTGADPSLTRRVTANAADEEPQALYALGMQSLRARNYARAVEYFDSIEREHPYSTWSTSAKLMAAYGDYLRNRYTEAIGRLIASFNCTRRIVISPMPTTCARFANMNKSQMRSATSAKPPLPWRLCRK